MGTESIIQSIIENIAIPAIVAFGGGVSLFIGRWVNKIGKSITLKNEIESIEKRAKARKDILDALRLTVEAAVGSNMQLANTMRQRNGKLTGDDIAVLKNTAKELIMNTLPESLKSEDGELLKIVGGRAQLDTEINVMIEQYVYEYKIKSSKQSDDNSSKQTKHQTLPSTSIHRYR